MQNNNLQNNDVLKELEDILNTAKQEIKITNEENKVDSSSFFVNDEINIKPNDIYEQETNVDLELDNHQTEIFNPVEYNPEEIIQENKLKTGKKRSFFSPVIFLAKYVLTSSLLFMVLLVTTNYSAYINIAKSYIFAWELEATSQKLITSVEASNIKEKYSEEAKSNEEDNEEKWEILSIKKMKREQDKKSVDLDIEITPYENRIIIPKIWQNIPLIDIKNRSIDGQDELNDIFMKELEKGIIRYPGSAKPGENGSSFIFGHSSNFPWIKWDYNDVFSLLDKVVYNDEVIVYYWQEKYTYKIKEKKVITPWDVSVLERNKDKSEITLMTCWPIWTTLNRLIVTWELIEIN